MHVSQKHAINNFTISNRRLGAEPKNFDQTELLAKPNFKIKFFDKNKTSKQRANPSKKTEHKFGQNSAKIRKNELLTISNFKVCTNTEPNQVRVNTTLILRIR